SSAMSEMFDAGITAEEFSRLPGKEHYELVAGRLQVSEPPGGLHGRIVVRVASLLDAHVRAHNLGTVLVETGYVVRRRPDTWRGPDVSFVSRGRLDPQAVPESFVGFAPDLAVEILSPEDRATEMLEKVHEYLRGGSSLVWVIDPIRQRIEVYRSGKPA